MGLFRRKRKDASKDVEAQGLGHSQAPNVLQSFGEVVPSFEPAPPATPVYMAAPYTVAAPATQPVYQAQDHHTTGTADPNLQALSDEKPKRQRWFSWKVRLFFGLPLALAALGGIAFGCMLVYYTMVFPDPLKLQHKERAPVIRILARDGSVLSKRGTAHDYMPLIMLPRHVIDAVVATEDRRFFSHWGFDPAGLLRATFANMRAGRFVQGGSTLTQQLAKNLFLSRERTIRRKLEELALATWLEVRLTKEDILELYLNRVYFGGGAYGIEAAAQRYYDKSARSLSIAEAAVIAGLLKAPSRYSPTASPTAARRRGRSVLNKMRLAKVITHQQYKNATADVVRFAKRKETSRRNAAAYAIDYILSRMPGLITGNHREIVVETTLDADLQKVSQDAVLKVLAGKAKEQRANQAALVLLDSDGSIRAMVGGRSHTESQFNRAVKARRQPGSAFKPFVYLAALENGLTPDSTTYDLPIKVDGWAPRNGSGTYQGAVSLRYALAKSINTVAVRLNQEVGSGRVIATAQRLGINSKLRPEPSLALGTSEVNLLELTGAYTVFANGGYPVEPFAIRRVRTNTGRVLYARLGAPTTPIVAVEHVGAMNDMLNAALVVGTGRRAGLPRHPAAGKTGTSQQFRDAWFVGYSAHMAAGVWLGNDNGRTMDKVMGGSFPAEIWRTVMMAAHEGKAPLALPGTLRAATSVSSQRFKQIYRARDRLSDKTVRLPGQQPNPVAANKPAKLQEVLPWQIRPKSRRKVVVKPLRSVPAPVRTPSAKRSPKPSKSKRPDLPISEDFIARALAIAPDGARGQQITRQVERRRAPTPVPKPAAPAAPRPMSAVQGYDAIAAQIEAMSHEDKLIEGPRRAVPPRRPRGMMTLGGGQ